MTHLLFGLLGGMLLCLCTAPSSARAQLDIPEVQGLSGTPQVEAGVELLRRGRPADAAALLRSALDADSALVSPAHGAAAYWLGRAYQQADQPEKARSAWRTGLRTLWNVGRFDARLADAYLRGLTPEQLRGERLYAVDVYRSLLGRVGTDTSEAMRSLSRRRVAQMAPLMADSALARVIQQDRSTAPAEWTFEPDAGAALVEWWRGLDPLPATDANERLEEHLTRLVRVRQNFACAERVSALDDRGLVHLRLGSPYKQRSLNYEDGEFFKEVYRFGVNVPPSSFPKSEIWLYTHIDESGFYLFAEDNTSDCFRQAKANELMPRYLTRQRADTERGLNIAYSALMAMRAIYRELALFHINFSTRYSKIANYASWQEMQATAARAAERSGGGSGSAGQRSTKVGAGVGQTRRVFSNPSMGYDYPTRFVSRMVTRAEREDREAVERREEAMPRQHTALLDETARLPVSVRTARFLDPDGTTRTEVYWGVPADRLRLGEAGAPASSLIAVSAAQYDDEHRLLQRTRGRYPVEVQTGTDTRMIVPSPLTLEGATGRYHLGLQWGQYQLWASDSPSEGKRMGPKRRVATARVDSLEPLRAEGPGVEMSDVKVLTLPDTSAQSLARPTEQATPYPFRTLTGDTPLLLSFELYHLAYGADDRTRYSIAYEAKGETKRGWTEIFRGTDTQRTSTEMTMAGTDRRTTEAILLDLSEIQRDEPQDVRVTVRVTDEVTGATVSRDIEFVLRPRAAEGTQ
ncbi:GWxTD domain-containing protein [Salinibacter ruber]|uniref:GWxTD domain-containing protein n=1 Tax=Salinibacter ruber TaxID=146919 RepID=UPI001F082871|nr:GWxTD domain-containing protein [Salinibacter ruber]MCS4034340.1 GWxTD domain-containing protein [Salinibacter ruber]